MKYALLGLAFIASAAYAYNCTTYTILTPNGAATCTKCCDSYGNCTVSCI